MRPHFLRPGNAESRHAAGRAARRAWERRQGVGRAGPGGRPVGGDLHLGGDRGEQPGGLRARRGRARAGARRLQPDRAPGGRRAGGAAGGGGVRRRPAAGRRRRGWPTPRAMAGAIRDDTRFATLMLANNETGAIQPVAELAALAAARGVPVHTDAVQAVGPDPGRLPRAGGRHAGGQRPQVPRAGGRGAAPGPRGGPARPAALRRRPAAGAPAGDGRRAAGRRPGRGAGTLAGRGRRAGRPLGPAPRPPGGGAGRRAGGRPGRPQRPARPGVAAPADAQRRLPRPRRRRPADAARPGRRLRLARLGLRQRLDPPVADAGRHARPRRPPPLLGPLQPRRDHHRGRDRRGRRAGRGGRRATGRRPEAEF